MNAVQQIKKKLVHSMSLLLKIIRSNFMLSYLKHPLSMSTKIEEIVDELECISHAVYGRIVLDMVFCTRPTQS